MVICCIKKSLETGGTGQEGLGVGEAGEMGGPEKAALREMKGEDGADERATHRPQLPGFRHYGRSSGSVTL